MTSPSDAAMDMNPVVAGKLLNEAWRAGSVLPLEFEAIDHPLRRKTDWMPHHDENFEVLNGLRAELASLDTRFRAQAQQVAGQIADSCREAKLEARQQWEVELEERVGQERVQVARTCTDFAAERTRYFAAVEGEVVRLALAIAERVLHREAKLDPLLLGAVVRVALEQVAEDSGTVLHVPVADLDAWRALLSEKPEATIRLVGEERIGATECFLETSTGRVELGVAVQLEEIEKGFFDLLQQRPV